MKTIKITYDPATCAEGARYGLLQQINELLSGAYAQVTCVTSERAATNEEIEEMQEGAH